MNFYRRTGYSFFIIISLFAANTFAQDIIINAKASYLQPRVIKSLKEIDPDIVILRNEYNVLLLKTKNKNFCRNLRFRERKSKTHNRLSCSYNLPVHFLDEMLINDTLYKDQWNLQAVHAEEAWTLSTGSDDTYVAILDTGIDYDSIDLSPNIWQKDYLNVDRYFHGTAVASVIASQGNNGYGLAGINWKTNIIPVKMLGDVILTFDMISAMNWVVELRSIGIPIRAINASYGRFYFDKTEYDAIKKLEDSGVIFVAAAGNSNFNVDSETAKKMYPASYDLENIISVGSINKELKHSYFSNYGKTIDILAPGENLYISKPGNLFTTASGTSFSAPHVTGAITLLDSYTGGYLTWQEIKSTILETATEYESLSDYAYHGRVLNIFAALQKYEYSPYQYADSINYLVEIRIKNKSKIRVQVLIKNNITGKIISKHTRKRNYDVILARGFYSFYIGNKNIKKGSNKARLKYNVFLTSPQRILFDVVLKKEKK